MGRNPSRGVRLRIIARDERCLRCGATENLTVDHIKPRSRGGTSEQFNLQTLCLRCNNAKASRYRAQIEKLGGGA